MVLPVLSAILGALAYLPANFWFLGFVFLAPLFIFFIRGKKFRRLVLGAFIFRFIFFLGAVYFTLEPIIWFFSILIFLGLPVSVFLVGKIFEKILPKINPDYLLLFSLPFLWTFFDHLEARYSLLPSYIITAGNIFGSSPFAGLAAGAGPLSLTFFAAAANAALAAAVLKIKARRRRAGILILAAAIFLIFLGWRFSDYQIRKNSAYYNGLKNSLAVAVVSANEKFDFGQADEIKKELAGKNFDLVIFPEDIFDEIGGAESFNFYKNLSENMKTNLLAVFDSEQNGRRYNSAFLFGEKGETGGIYNKNRLTFMGEYWPFGGWRPFFYDWLKKINPGSEDYAIFRPENSYSQGGKKILSLNSGGRTINFSALICLEGHYPGDLKKYKKMGAEFFVNQSSNRWLSLGLNHFLYLENNLRKSEAIWLKAPIITSGVRDLSGIILPNGKIISANYESPGKNFGIFFGEIKY